MEFEYKWADPSDAAESDAIRRFVLAHFGAESIQAGDGRLEWIARDHPGGAHTAVCYRADRLAAVCFHLACGVRLGDEVRSAAFGLDLLVAPEARRQGVGTALLGQRIARFGLSLSTGQSAEMGKVYRHDERFRVLARWRRGVYQRRLPRRGAWRARLRDTLAWLLARSRPTVRGVRRPLDLAGACALLEELPGRLGNGEAGLELDSPYLRWRYGGPVYADHVFARLEGAGGARGLLVTRREGDTELLVELVCAADHRVELLRLAGRTTPGDRMVAAVAGMPLERALGSAGFLVRPLDAEVVAASDDLALLGRVESLDWVSFAGDSDTDLIRPPAAPRARSER